MPSFVCLFFVYSAKETFGFLLYAKRYARFGNRERNKAEPYIYDNDDEMWLESAMRNRQEGPLSTKVGHLNLMSRN